MHFIAKYNYVFHLGNTIQFSIYLTICTVYSQTEVKGMACTLCLFCVQTCSLM